MQHGALEEVRAQVVDDVFFFLGELIGIFCRVVDGGKIGVVEFIALAIAQHGEDGAEIDLVQQATALHVEVRVAADELALQLEHDHRDRALGRLDRGFIRVDVRGEGGERAQADAIAALEYVGVVVAQGVAHDGGDAGIAAESRAHPEHVVIAPLDVHRGMLHQQVQYGVGAVAAVEEVADDVQAVDGQALDEHGERDDEVGAAVNLYDGIEQALVVDELRVVRLGPRIHELDDDGGAALRDKAAHLRGRILEAHELGELQQLGEVAAVPGRRVAAFIPDLLQLFLRVVDERAELGLFLGR